MSITIETAQLVRAMKHAASVVENKQTLPILGSVLLRADGDTLELATTNLDVEFRQVLPLASGGGLETTVDARRLFALAQAAGNGSQLKLEMDGNQLAVRNGRSRWKMPVLPAEDFPAIPFDGDCVRIEMGGAALAQALGRVMWSVGTEQIKHYLLGPLLHGEEGKLAFAATNGHTLMRSITDVALPDRACDIILMPKFCRLVEAITAEAAQVILEWDEAKIRLSVGDTTLTAKVIDGTFPDYRRVIPTQGDTPLVVDPQSLKSAVRKTVVLASEKTNCLKVARGQDSLTLSITSPGVGDSRSEQPAECAEGFETGFNAKYLEQMLDAIGGDSLVIHQSEAGAPARFERLVGDGAVGVIMPIRV